MEHFKILAAALQAGLSLTCSQTPKTVFSQYGPCSTKEPQPQGILYDQLQKRSFVHIHQQQQQLNNMLANPYKSLAACQYGLHLPTSRFSLHHFPEPRSLI